MIATRVYFDLILFQEYTKSKDSMNLPLVQA